MMFVERQEQLASFATALTECRAGRGRLMAVIGSLASGKTTLLRAFADHAADVGFDLLRATGTRTERQLPLGLIDQFCHNLPPAADGINRAGLVREVHSAAARYDRRNVWGTVAAGRPLTRILSNVSAALLTASEHTPILLMIDDLHHFDPLSLHWLLHLATRIRNARILIVVGGGDVAEPTDPQLYVELVELASDNYLALPPLSRRGVGELLAEALADRPAEALVDACVRASGGNPLLAQMFIADLRDSGQPSLARDGKVQPGPAFTSAVRRYVERCDPVIRRVLAGTALLDGRSSARVLMLARLTMVDTAMVRRVLASLARTGIISDGQIPHPLARQAVLDQLPPEVLTDLHLHAAQLMHDEGSPPLPIAQHLLAAGRAPDWARPVLVAAAEALLSISDTELAIGMLRLAHGGATDDRERAMLKVALLRAEWSTDPAAAGHRLGQLVAAARAGQLSVAARVTTAHCLLWLGRSAEAVGVIEGLSALDSDVEYRDSDYCAEARLLIAWSRFTHPGLLGDERARFPVGEPLVPRRGVSGAISIRDGLAHAVETMRTVGPNGAALATAEQTLQRSSMGGDGDALASVAAALTILILGDRLELATLWADRLLAQANERGARFWQGTLRALRADIALRSGHLADAQRHAEAALGILPRESWATTIGYPLGILLLAHTARGRLAEAGHQLDHAVPDAMFQTVWGLYFLRARGCYYLATGQAEAALDDFTTCWDLMARWDLDLPAIVPWRVYAARAHLALNQPEQARRLAEGQLEQIGPEPSRAAAAALRVLAALAPLAQRPTLLREAAEMLRAGGDRLELAHTLADLSQAQRSLGDFHRARITVRRACDLATTCQADGLRQRLFPDLDQRTPAPTNGTDLEAVNSLSDAERRVATLAAQGSTNRQIATRLYVTVSTVEQHLTKAYRKLNVNRRADLLVKLGSRIGEIA